MVDPPPPTAAPIKRLQTLPPDVIVSVGGVEFECYKLALCFASNYLTPCSEWGCVKIRLVGSSCQEKISRSGRNSISLRVAKCLIFIICQRQGFASKMGIAGWSGSGWYFVALKHEMTIAWWVEWKIALVVKWDLWVTLSLFALLYDERSFSVYSWWGDSNILDHKESPTRPFHLHWVQLPRD